MSRELNVRNEHLNLGEFLYETRKEKGLTLDALSEITNINETTISRLENAKAETRFGNVMLIVEALGTTLTAYENWKIKKYGVEE